MLDHWVHELGQDPIELFGDISYDGWVGASGIMATPSQLPMFHPSTVRSFNLSTSRAQKGHPFPRSTASKKHPDFRVFKYQLICRTQQTYVCLTMSGKNSKYSWFKISMWVNHSHKPSPKSAYVRGGRNSSQMGFMTWLYHLIVTWAVFKIPLSFHEILLGFRDAPIGWLSSPKKIKGSFLSPN